MEPDTSNTNGDHTNQTSENQNAFFGNGSRVEEPSVSLAEDTDGPVPTAAVSDGHGPTGSDNDGHRPTQTDTDGQEPAPSQRSDLHTVTSDEAVQMFRHAGVPRTRRSITRWCEKKNGEEARLECRKDGNDGRIYISQESIELAIEEERAKDERWRNRLDAVAQDPERRRLPVTEADGQEPERVETETEKMEDTSRERTKNDRELRARITFLEGEVLLKEKIAEHYIAERERIFERVEMANRYVGRLENHVREREGSDSEVLRLGERRFSSEPDDSLGITEERDRDAA